MATSESPTLRMTWKDRAIGLSTSVGAHVVIIVALILTTFTIPREEAATTEIIADIPEEDLQIEEVIDTFVTTETTGSMGETGPGPASDLASASMAALPGSTGRPPAMQQDQDFQRLEMDAPSRPLTTSAGELGLTEVVPGIVGATMDAGGVEGSVDRVTAEILHQLSTGPVLVVWLFDASGSQKDQRRLILERFDRINQELNKLGKLREDLLLNAVVSFGSEVDFLTPTPVSDIASLQSAVSEIGEDKSGQERIFSAVRESARRYRRYQSQEKRTVMMIIVTDEIGDDLPAIDECLQVVRRNKIPVYVMGPAAPFGKKSIDVTWVDIPTGESFQVPVDRGPESVLPEHLPLPYWGPGAGSLDLLTSGFGPYGLSMLTRMSGGIYFLFDDGRLGNARLDRPVMSRYAPDYLSLSDYSKMLAKYPLRRVITEVVRGTESSLAQPRLNFSAENLNAALSEAQKAAAATATTVEQALAALLPLEKERAAETSLRWRAHYDLIVGRLLATRVRTGEYNWALAQMKVNPARLEGKNNSWRIVGDKEVRFGKTVNTKASGPAKRDAKVTEQAQQDAAKALELLERVKEEHAGTPWALLAEHELQIPLGFRWEQYYVEPPKPPSQAEQMSRQKRDEAAKRIPKL